MRSTEKSNARFAIAMVIVSSAVNVSAGMLDSIQSFILGPKIYQRFEDVHWRPVPCMALLHRHSSDCVAGLGFGKRRTSPRIFSE